MDKETENINEKEISSPKLSWSNVDFSVGDHKILTSVWGEVDIHQIIKKKE